MKAIFKIIVIFIVATTDCFAADSDNLGWTHPVLRWSAPSRKDNPQAQGNLIHQKLNQIIIPDLQLLNTSLPETVALLNRLSVAGDKPSHKGVAFRLRSDSTDPAQYPTLTISLHKVSLRQATQYVAKLADLQVVELADGVIFVSQ